MKRGDIVAFRGNGPVFKVLSFVLGLFEPEWRKREWKPWHLAIASQETPDGWMLVEAVAGGVQEIFHDTASLQRDSRSYSWLDAPPSKKKIEEFKTIYLGYPYDGTAYVGITVAYLFKKVTKKSFRIIDTEHLCWETACAFVRFCGKPLQPIWEYPMICRLIKTLED